MVGNNWGNLEASLLAIMAITAVSKILHAIFRECYERAVTTYGNELS